MLAQWGTTELGISRAGEFLFSRQDTRGLLQMFLKHSMLNWKDSPIYKVRVIQY